MTNTQHDAFSELIFPVDNQENLIEYYNTLNIQEPIVLKSEKKLPTDKDYEAGFFVRYFARKANEQKVLPFEIASEMVGTSPLYEYTSLRWYISGILEQVQFANNRSIELATDEWPNIRGLFNSPLQYFKHRLKHRLKHNNKVHQQVLHQE